ncbi:mRNA turnover protein 4 homolog [Homalodisca vitripennis]|uniref:mRNA turnover protein 4 homolog n=1 Tax=Homalodisca vitripennis TaxID=197043 RepID=UPI001EEB78E8|nr:mRNA turnover protein 4 homolog [Homalodisca vitripennis]
MPVSKRDKKVSLTKTTKKGMGLKQKLVENIRKSLETHENLFVFTTRNMRNGPLKDARDTWLGSRFFMGKPKVMAFALGRTEAEEQHKDLHKVSPFVKGQCGLLLTSKPKDEVIQWFHSYSNKSYARSGFVPTETIKLEAGPLQEFAAAMEPHLRSLGLPTQLEKGKIILREDHTVCTQGVPITPEQAGILKLLKIQIAEFKLTPLCVWSKEGYFKKLKGPKEESLVATTPITSNTTTTTTTTTTKSTPEIPNNRLEDEEMETEKMSPDFRPRRSTRIKKPLKRTPEERRSSIKKLTGTPSLSSKGTPSRKSVRNLKISE